MSKTRNGGTDHHFFLTVLCVTGHLPDIRKRLRRSDWRQRRRPSINSGHSNTRLPFLRHSMQGNLEIRFLPLSNIHKISPTLLTSPYQHTIQFQTSLTSFYYYYQHTNHFQTSGSSVPLSKILIFSFNEIVTGLKIASSKSKLQALVLV